MDDPLKNDSSGAIKGYIILHRCVILCQEQTAHNQSFIISFQLPGIGLFELPSMPDTSLEGTGKDEYAADGLKIEAVEPMKKWHIQFDGKLRWVFPKKCLILKKGKKRTFNYVNITEGNLLNIHRSLMANSRHEMYFEVTGFEIWVRWVILFTIKNRWCMLRTDQYITFTLE